ncbi:hypothetical protein RIF29_16948 [Crotalaria pallida]|uniref:TPX2 central domain-containing protein n=1 Tax=Crotalaria pallida TaxID=3830 RepID=A0AAN9FHK1_CROPI
MMPGIDDAAYKKKGKKIGSRGGPIRNTFRNNEPGKVILTLDNPSDKKKMVLSTPRLPAFQEFHLKTSERAMQHTSATSSSSLQCNDFDEGLDKHHAISTTENRTKDLRRPSAMGASKNDRLVFAYNFKARPLDKKLSLLSKGDIGVFRNRKLETTVPTEFNFQTEKRVQHNPPINLFSKLSLTSEVQSSNGSQLKPPRHYRAFREDSKENIGSSFHLDQKEKPFMFVGNQIHNGSDGCISEAGTLFGARRSLGIR